MPAAPGEVVARLGHHTRPWLAGLRGDVLILGCDERRQHASVPRPVVDAATRSGLFGPDAGLVSLDIAMPSEP